MGSIGGDQDAVGVVVGTGAVDIGTLGVSTIGEVEGVGGLEVVFCWLPRKGSVTVFRAKLILCRAIYVGSPACNVGHMVDGGFLS